MFFDWRYSPYWSDMEPQRIRVVGDDQVRKVYPVRNPPKVTTVYSTSCEDFAVFVVQVPLHSTEWYYSTLLQQILYIHVFVYSNK
jgi:hypothetical protein